MLKPLTGIGLVPISLAMIHASMGRYNEAADVLLEAVDKRTDFPKQRALSRDVAALLRTAPAPAPSVKTLPRFGIQSWVYLHIGAPERALEFYEEEDQSGFFLGQGGDFGFLWHPSYAPVRKTERFKTLARNGGLVEYWRAKGWPDFCRPTTGDDFECD